MGLVSSAMEGAFDRLGSLFLEVEAEAVDFMFAEDRAGWRSVRFWRVNPTVSVRIGREGAGRAGGRSHVL